WHNRVQQGLFPCQLARCSTRSCLNSECRSLSPKGVSAISTCSSGKLSLILPSTLFRLLFTMINLEFLLSLKASAKDPTMYSKGVVDGS
ncbi:MAG: hypothetical protein M3P08_16080, partial [Thermoproteota archaeon]|nr:hypothetical protein [Thermoproteota archaeon]